MQGCGGSWTGASALQDLGWALTALGAACLGWWERDAGRGWGWWSWCQPPDLGRSPRVPVRTQNFLRLPAWSLGEAPEPKLSLGPLWSCFLLHLESPQCEYWSVLAPPLRGPLPSVGASSKLSWVPSPVALGLQGQAIHQTEDASLEGGE